MCVKKCSVPLHLSPLSPCFALGAVQGSAAWWGEVGGHRVALRVGV